MARSSIYPPSVQPGKPHLPQSPAGWATVAFRDIFEVVERPVALLYDEEYQLITAKRSRGGIIPRERLTGRDILTKTQFFVAEDDFLISNRQIVHGGCGIVPPGLDGAVVSNEYTVLRPKETLSIDYLKYLPHAVYFQQTCFHASVGVDVEKMVFDIDQWLSFRINLPPLYEQRRIAEILSSIDDAIASTQAVVGQTYTVKQSLLQHLLTKGIDHTSFKQTEIGEIPETWKVYSLGEIATIKAGATPPRKDSDRYFVGGSIPWVKTGDLTNGSIFSTEECVTQAAIAETSCRIHPPETVLIAMYGGFQQIGRTGILRIEAATNQAISALALNHQLVLPEFILHSLNAFKPRWKDIAASSRKDPNIKKDDIISFPVPVPSKEEQERIIKIANALEVSASVEASMLRRLENIKEALLSDLLAGRKRVETAELVTE